MWDKVEVQLILSKHSDEFDSFFKITLNLLTRIILSLSLRKCVAEINMIPKDTKIWQNL